MRQVSPAKITNYWLRQYILLGYIAKGIIYLLIGVFAVQAAVFYDREATGTYLSLTSLAEQPLGKLLVFMLAIALMGYVLRRLFQMVLLPQYSAISGFKCLFKRAGYMMSALSYAGVAYSAMNIALEIGEYDDTAEDLADEIFELPIGEWLIFLGGIAVLTVGIFYIWGAYTGSYISEFESSDIHHRVEKWTRRIGKYGVAARGISFVLTGVFIVQAALVGDSEFAGGLQNALQALVAQPLGELWLSLIGLGFIAYGLYMFVAAKYRRYAIK